MPGCHQETSSAPFPRDERPMARAVPLAAARQGVYPSMTAALEALRSGEASARQLLEGCLDAIGADNDDVNAVVHADSARAAADASDAAIKRGHHRGRLQGLPVTIKESFDVQGMPTTWGDPGRAGCVAQSDSVVTARLRAAGAVLIGKTNIPRYLGDWETDNPLFGGTRNPHDLNRSAGGSSGGSAAAVAAGYSYADIGSDRGGSIRLPAHYCGVHGLKPSWGLIPVWGHSVGGERRESDIGVAGPIARAAEDLTPLLKVLAGPSEIDSPWQLSLPPPHVSGVSGMRLALMLDHPACPIDHAYHAALDRVVAGLRSQGASFDGSARPDIDLDRATELMNLMVRAGSSVDLDDDAMARQARIVAGTDQPISSYRRLQARGSTLSHRDWLKLHEERLWLCDAWRSFFEMYDFLLCPVSASTAPPFQRVEDVITRKIVVNGSELPVLAQHFWLGLASLCYLPAQSAPLGNTTDGLPFGIQVIGPRFGDLKVIALSGLLSRASVSAA